MIHIGPRSSIARGREAAPPDDRSQLVIDTALGVVVLIVVGTAVTANVGGDGTVSPAAYAFGALFGALMLVRRRLPVTVLIVTAVALLGYYMLSYPPIGLAVPVAAALYSAAECGRLYWACGTALALLGVSTAVRIGQGDDLSYVLGLETPTSATLMLAVIALGDSVRSRRGWRAELDRQAAAAALEQETEATRRVEEERVRIARDLHDLLAHTVSVISLHTDVARETLHDEPATAERSLVAARTACRDAGRELRATVDALRAPDAENSEPGSADARPGLNRLEELVDTATVGGLHVDVHTAGTPRTLPVVSDVTAYRVVQEALSNVLRHADATTATVAVDYGEDVVTVRVSDDGRGAAAADPAGGWGITGMRERLTLLGGTLRIRTRLGEGFDVTARIPAREDS
ncbi:MULTISPECIES: sensor histidine kinase [Prauserella salsuginis group]|uniref:histidine kinase n=1 Tax=Prauserella salsuginis TaxID=387889 RepID=A0ABW6G091_9PSEU|nr:MULTISPECIES: sensor histidine kinase [Prauserella salsuginis group]MCR3721230.1 Signal transduction histidine kinase [Prauserella flava]MCR3734689.1 Signal transduction histidine kinase [Prauserella salsuginis]